MSQIKLLTILILFTSNLTAQSLVDRLFFSNPENYSLKAHVKKLTETSFITSEKTDPTDDDCPKIIEFNIDSKTTHSTYCELILYFDYEYIYDENGLLIEKYNPNNSEEFKYDKRNNLIERKYGVSKDGFYGSWTYKYDEKNNQIERIGFLGHSFVERWKHIYNNDNRRIKEIMVDEVTDSTIYIIRNFEYDDNGNVTRQQYLPDGSNTQEWNDFFKYNKYDDRIEWKRIDSNGYEEIELYEYKYDYANNWVEKKTFKNNKLKETRRRDIDYW